MVHIFTTIFIERNLFSVIGFCNIVQNIFCRFPVIVIEKTTFKNLKKSASEQIHKEKNSIL